MKPEQIDEALGRATADLLEAGAQCVVVIVGYDQSSYAMRALPHDAMLYAAGKQLADVLQAIDAWEEPLAGSSEGEEEDDATDE